MQRQAKVNDEVVTLKFIEAKHLINKKILINQLIMPEIFSRD